jgi:hypothetical protein
MPIRALSRPLGHALAGLALALVFAFAAWAQPAPDISRFVGEYSGSAEVERQDGSRMPRDMSVRIAETRNGFSVEWTSVTYRSDGRVTEKSYAIDFQPSDRFGVFAAAMRQNVFGHAVPLDPMKGEPYVWARLNGDTLTVFSLYVTNAGDYDLQQFDRTLTDGGLDLEFTRFSAGVLQTRVKTFLQRE